MLQDVGRASASSQHEHHRRGPCEAEDDPDVIVLGSPTVNEHRSEPAADAPRAEAREGSSEPVLVSQSGFDLPPRFPHSQSHGLNYAPVQPNGQPQQHIGGLSGSQRPRSGAAFAAASRGSAAAAAGPGVQLHANLGQSRPKPKQQRQAHILVLNQALRPQTAAPAQPSAASVPAAGQAASTMQSGAKDQAQPVARQQQEDENGHLPADDGADDAAPAEDDHPAAGKTIVAPIQYAS